jgi:hypothetical protein
MLSLLQTRLYVLRRGVWLLGRQQVLPINQG